MKKKSSKYNNNKKKWVNGNFIFVSPRWEGVVAKIILWGREKKICRSEHDPGSARYGSVIVDFVPVYR